MSSQGLSLPTASIDRFARFPRTVDLSDRSRCSTVVIAALASRREARNSASGVTATITSIAQQIDASASHIGQRTLRELEAVGHITRKGGKWFIGGSDNSFIKFPSWIMNVGLSRNAIVVMLGICSGFPDTDDGRFTVTSRQLSIKLGMSRTRVINCVKELSDAGALIVHRARVDGRHDYNKINRYTVCYKKFLPKPQRRRSSVAWQPKTQQFLDLLANNPEWAQRFAEEVPSKGVQREIERLASGLAHERSPAALAKAVLDDPRGLHNAKNAWSILKSRLRAMSSLEDQQLAQARAAERRGEISKAQLDLVEQQVQTELDLLGHTFRPE